MHSWRRIEVKMTRAFIRVIHRQARHSTDDYDSGYDFRLFSRKFLVFRSTESKKTIIATTKRPAGVKEILRSPPDCLDFGSRGAPLMVGQPKLQLGGSLPSSPYQIGLVPPFRRSG